MKNTEERSQRRLLFDKLVTEKRGKVYSVAYGFFHNAEDAKDVSQDVFRKAWERLDSLRDETKADSWLLSIAYNACKNHKRSMRSLEHLDESIPAPEEDNSLKERISRELKKLDPEKRMALVLLEYEGMSYKEIAETMNKKEGAVKSIIFRAREDMKELLKDLVTRRKSETR